MWRRCAEGHKSRWTSKLPNLKIYSQLGGSTFPRQHGNYHWLFKRYQKVSLVFVLLNNTLILKREWFVHPYIKTFWCIRRKTQPLCGCIVQRSHKSILTPIPVLCNIGLLGSSDHIENLRGWAKFLFLRRPACLDEQAPKLNREESLGW